MTTSSISTSTSSSAVSSSPVVFSPNAGEEEPTKGASNTVPPLLFPKPPELENKQTQQSNIPKSTSTSDAIPLELQKLLAITARNHYLQKEYEEIKQKISKGNKASVKEIESLLTAFPR